MFSSSLLSLVLAASALALPSNLERSATNLARSTPTYPSNWAGAVLANYPNNTFKSVSAGFTVPTPRLPPSGGNSSTIFYEATALVGLDGVSPCVNTLQAGVDSILEKDGVTTNYVAWWTWSNTPDQTKQEFTGNFSVTAGDSVSFTISVDSPTSGVVTAVNTRLGPVNGVASSGSLTNKPALCLATAEWIVNQAQPTQYHTLANFTEVKFSLPQAETFSGTYVGPIEAAIVDIIEPNGQVVTSTTVDEFDVTVDYVLA